MRMHPDELDIDSGLVRRLLAAQFPDWAGLPLEPVFPHNAAGIALYRKFGFVDEGRRVMHYRRASGELWDAIEMGLLL